MVTEWCACIHSKALSPELMLMHHTDPLFFMHHAVSDDRHIPYFDGEVTEIDVVDDR